MEGEAQQLVAEFEKQSGLVVKHSVLASKLTTIAIGGELPVVIEPNSLEELSTARSLIEKLNVGVRYLGAGSNLLVPDEGIADWVIKLGRGFRSVTEIAPCEFEVGGAMSLMSLSRDLSQQGYAGLEFAGGIPASIGGAVRMNAGAHGGELADVLTQVQVLHPDGSSEWLPAATFNFSYRHAELSSGAMIVAARLRLVKSTSEKTARQRSDFLAHRKKTQPLTQPSSGSVFRNPAIDQAAGFLLEQVGLRGHRIGGASISAMHGNWIVNLHRQARSQDVLDLIALCQSRVLQRYQVALKPEIVSWG